MWAMYTGYVHGLHIRGLHICGLQYTYAGYMYADKKMHARHTGVPGHLAYM